MSEEILRPHVLLTITPSGQVNRLTFPSRDEACAAGAFALYGAEAEELALLFGNEGRLKKLWIWWKTESQFPFSFDRSYGRDLTREQVIAGAWVLPVPEKKGEHVVACGFGKMRGPNHTSVAEVYPEDKFCELSAQLKGENP